MTHLLNGFIYNHLRADSVRLVNSVLPESCHPKVRKLAEYWLAIHPTNALPGRQHFDPIDVPSLLPNLWLLDVQHDPIRFRLRLLGTRIIDYAGEDNTGKWVDEKWPNFENSVFTEIAKSGQPSWYRGPSKLRPEKDYYELELIDMILALTVFFDSHGNEIS